MLADSTSGYIYSALIAGFFGVVVVVVQWRLNRNVKAVHDEVRTNHGKRQGERIETMGDDIAQIKRTMVTKVDLEEHARHDLEVAADLRQENQETRSILLAAIRINGEK